MIIKLEKIERHIEEVAVSLTVEEMVEQVAMGNLFDGFLGGVEASTEEIENNFIGNDEPNYQKWIDSYINGGMLTYKSLDGENVLIRICRPYSATAWRASDAEIFEMFLELFGIERFMTKSNFQIKIESEEYRKPIADF